MDWVLYDNSLRHERVKKQVSFKHIKEGKYQFVQGIILDHKVQRRIENFVKHLRWNLKPFTNPAKSSILEFGKVFSTLLHLVSNPKSRDCSDILAVLYSKIF